MQSSLSNKLRRIVSRNFIPIMMKLDHLSNRYWHDLPFGSTPLAPKEDYLHLAKEVKKQTYPEVDTYEKKTGFAIDSSWLHELALHTQVVLKDSPLCYAHGRILYSALSSWLSSNPAFSLSDRLTIFETGTARGFSSLCMAKALQNQKRPGTILTFDLLPHRTKMFWNCIDDLEGPKTRAELLQPWNSLLIDYLIFHQGDTRIELPKVDAERIHFAFLDGSHTYKDVMFEFEHIGYRQKKGDMIVYDDYSPNNFPGLVKAVDEICDIYKYKRTNIVANSIRGYVIAVKNY